MEILIVKRLESSIHAFEHTLDRFIKSYERVLTEFRKGNVYISKDHINKIFELLEHDDMEAIDRLIEEDKAEKLSAKDFSDDFHRDLASDLKILRYIQEMWSKIRRDPKWGAFKETLLSESKLKKSRIIVFTESKETAEYLAEKIAKLVEPKVVMFHGQAGEAAHREVMSNFDANAFELRENYRILVSTEALSEGVNLYRSNIVINYDIPWNPTRLIQRVGRVNRVDTKFEKIHTYNFFPTEEGNDLLKLREAAEAKIQAFIEMLGADARLLTEGEEIKSHDLFMKLNSRKTITGEDEEEESELEYLTEIRAIRDKQPDLFARIKRLPKKARSTRTVTQTSLSAKLNTNIPVCEPPALLTYFRQHTLDKFFVVPEGDPVGINPSQVNAMELDFFSTAKMLKPLDTKEKRESLPQNFYDLLDKNKKAFAAATSVSNDEEVSTRSGGKNDAYILKRLRAKEIRAYQGFTEDDENYIQQVIQLLIDGALPRPTTKKVAEALKDEIEPLRVLGILRRDIPELFFQQTRARAGYNYLSPREVILSSYITASLSI